MPLRITPQEAYARGKQAANTPFVCGDLMAYFKELAKGWRQTYPLSRHLNYEQEITKNWADRLKAAPDLTKYPECRGLADVVLAEHQGFLDACGDPVRTAVHFNHYFYCTRVLGPRYFGFPPELLGNTKCYAQTTAAECSAVWFEDSIDGPLHAKNLDTMPSQKADSCIPSCIPDGKPFRGVRAVGGGSAPVLYDEEPTEIFPVKIDDVYPDDIHTVKEHVKFLERYQQFSGPGNCIWVDGHGDSVAIEHSNCRMGYRFSENGVSAVTALAYRTPHMKAFKEKQDRKSLELRGWDETAPDWVYWKGCDKRYDRMMQLVHAEAKRGPSAVGLAKIMLDPDGPVPGRISIANEPFHPDVPTDHWTMYTWVAVPFGDKRRTYWWKQKERPDGPIFKQTPTLHLGDGVQMNDELKRELAAMTAIGKN